MTALISVTDKSNLHVLVEELSAKGVQIVSTGRTARTIAELGAEVTPIEEFTGTPEMLDGRVKTLHPRVFGGVMADPTDEMDAGEIELHRLCPFDLVVVNLYKLQAGLDEFDQGTADGAALSSLMKKVDIGGVSLIRATYKMIFMTDGRLQRILVSDPLQYEMALDVLFGRVPSAASAAGKRIQMATTAHDHVFDHFLAEHELIDRLISGH